VIKLSYNITAAMLGAAYLQHIRYLSNLEVITIMLDDGCVANSKMMRLIKEQAMEKATAKEIF